MQVGIPQLEVCVDTIEGLMAAKVGGADRVELCSSLSDGGLTPSAGLIRAAADVDISCFAMIRPRSGNFQYTAQEIEIMLHDISVVQDHGLDGVVIGAETDDGALDLDVLNLLLVRATGLGSTLHRVVDCVMDQLKAVDQAIDLGFDRILTSGGAPTALAGSSKIANMVARSNRRIGIMPGSGITEHNVQKIAAATGATEFHASCRRAITKDIPHMFEASPILATNADAVRSLKAEILTTRQAEGS